MPDTTQDTLAKSPENPITGEVRPRSHPSERPGTEAQEAREASSPPKPQGEGPPAGERNTAAGGSSG